MRSSALDRAEGFSLVESLIACGVLAAGVLSVVQLFALAAAMSVTSRQTTAAAILAAQKLEELRAADAPAVVRSEEHTSELQSQSNLVCRLLLEKKKKQKSTKTHARY